jgi:hypothetical protein
MYFVGANFETLSCLGHGQSGNHLIGSLGRGCETCQLVEQLLYPAFESCPSIIVHSSGRYAIALILNPAWQAHALAEERIYAQIRKFGFFPLHPLFPYLQP